MTGLFRALAVEPQQVVLGSMRRLIDAYELRLPCRRHRRRSTKMGQPVSTMTGLAVQKMEERLISVIAVCERDVRRGERKISRA